MLAVFRKLLADRRRASDIRFNGRDIGRRRFGRFAEQPIHHKRPARHRRGGRAVGGDFQNRTPASEIRRAGNPREAARGELPVPVTLGMP